VHISSMRRYPASFQRGMVLMTQTSHEYFVSNAQSRCVAISYTSASWIHERRPRGATSGSGSDEVQEMIRRTLRTE
jgi:hypothetical protein